MDTKKLDSEWKLDAANAIDRLAYQAQGYCKDAKHAESVADELRRLLEKEKERADKFMWQVRDTCARAEAAETHSAALARALEEAKGVWKPISALWSKPAECGKGCPPRQVCDFCQRELFLGWNGDYVELWNTTNYYLCRERSEPHWKHMAEEAARLTHFMAFDMPDRARSLLAPKEDTANG